MTPVAAPAVVVIAIDVEPLYVVARSGLSTLSTAGEGGPASTPFRTYEWNPVAQPEATQPTGHEGARSSSAVPFQTSVGPHPVRTPPGANFALSCVSSIAVLVPLAQSACDVQNAPPTSPPVA